MLIKSQNVHLQINSFLPFHGPKLEWYSGYTDQVAWIIQSNFEINIMENKTTANFKKKMLTMAFICIQTFSPQIDSIK